MISNELGVSLPTVLRMIEELIDEKLVRPLDRTEWTRGRRRQLFELNKDDQAVVGIDLGGTKMFGALANIGGQIIHDVNLNEHATSGDASLEQLAVLIRGLLDAASHRGLSVRGIAVGAPGVTRSAEGIVEWAPSLDWRDFPLQQKLQEQFPMPVLVDNDVNLAALGELWFGVGQNTSNMVLIAIGTGVGAGIIIDGALYRGHSDASGEIGYLLTERAALGKRYDRFGAMEEIVSGTGIAARAQRLLASRGQSDESVSVTAESVFQAARDGQEWALELVAETVDYLSIAIANVSALFNPELIVLGGGVASSADLLIEPIVKNITGVVPVVPRLVASTLGRCAAVMGAIVRVVHATSDYFVVRRLS